MQYIINIGLIHYFAFIANYVHNLLRIKKKNLQRKKVKRCGLWVSYGRHIYVFIRSKNVITTQTPYWNCVCYYILFLLFSFPFFLSYVHFCVQLQLYFAFDCNRDRATQYTQRVTTLESDCVSFLLIRRRKTKQRETIKTIRRRSWK